MRRKATDRFEVAWLDPSELQIDPTYQRSFKPAWADHIVANFDPDQVRPLDVVRRSSTELMVENGQHTLHALVEKGWKSVPCFVRNGSTTLQAEAEHFIRVNSNSKSLSPLEIFHAALTAKRPSAIEINSIVESFGLKVASNQPTAISAVKALEHVYAKFGPEGLRDTLYVITKAWDDDHGRFKATLLKAMALFLANNNTLDRDKIIAKLSRISPDSLLRKVGEGNGSNSVTPMLAAVIEKSYRSKR